MNVHVRVLYELICSAICISVSNGEYKTDRHKLANFITQHRRCVMNCRGAYLCVAVSINQSINQAINQSSKRLLRFSIFVTITNSRTHKPIIIINNTEKSLRNLICQLRRYTGHLYQVQGRGGSLNKWVQSLCLNIVTVEADLTCRGSFFQD